MKLEKFDLEKALNGAKVVTRDGQEVKELTKCEVSSNDFPLVGVLDSELKTWTIEGKYMAYELGQSSLDLFLAVEPRSIWVNVYKIKGHINLGAICYTKEEAENKNYDPDKYIKTIEITDEL